MSEKSREQSSSRDVGGAGLRALGLIGLLAAAAVVGARKLGDPDLPWHLAFGRSVVGAKSLVRIDPLAMAGRPIQYAEYVSDISLFAVWRAGGPVALQVATAMAVVGCALPLFVVGRRHGPFVVPVVALAVAAMGPWWIARPATLSFVLLALLLWLIDVRRRAGGTRTGRIALATTALLLLVWANVHGFVVLGGLLVLGYGVYAALARLLDGRLEPWVEPSAAEDWRFTLGVVVVALAATCVNSAGLSLWLAPFAASRDFVRIGEWQAPTLGLMLEFAPAALVLALIALVALSWGRDHGRDDAKTNVFDLLVVLGGLGIGASTVRLVPMAALLVAPFVVRRLSSWVRPIPSVRAACAVSALLVAPVLAIDPGVRWGRGFDLRQYPETAVRFIQATKLVGPMWNHMPFGGWLAWRLHPAHKVLVDGRTGWVHDPVLVRDVIESERDVETFRRVVEAHGLEWAVTRASEGLPFGSALAKTPEWKMVHLDDTAAVYVRLGGPNDGLGQSGYRLLRHDVDRQDLLRFAATGQRASDLAHDAERALSDDPESGRAAFCLAAAAIAGVDEALWARARSVVERHPEAHVALPALEAAWQGRVGAK